MPASKVPNVKKIQMYSRCINVFLLGTILFFAASCESENLESLKCDAESRSIVIGVWENPQFFITGTNCAEGVCVEMKFTLNNDSSYELDYKVSDSNTILTDFSDQGTFDFTCLSRGHLSGRYSHFESLNSEILLTSNSLSQTLLSIDWNGLEGLLFLPEYLGISDAKSYIKLR